MNICVQVFVWMCFSVLLDMYWQLFLKNTVLLKYKVHTKNKSTHTTSVKLSTFHKVNTLCNALGNQHPNQIMECDQHP